MARNKYQYGTSPRKLEPEYSPYRQRKTNNIKPKEVSKTHKKIETSALKAEKIKTTKKICIVLKVNIENSINLNNIEQAAKEKLGMQKLTNKQTIYVNLPKKDYIESASEEVIIQEDESVFKKIINLFKK